MSAENCPFDILRYSDDTNTPREDKKDMFISFDIAITAGASSTTISQRFKKLDSTHPEDILNFISRYDELINALGTPVDQARFDLMNVVLTGDPSKKWRIILTRVNQRSNAAMQRCIEIFYACIWMRKWLLTPRIG